MHPINLDEYEQLAKNKLDPVIFDYIYTGATDCITLKRNRHAFNDIELKPRVLRNVSRIHTEIKIFEHSLSAPILIAPCAFQQLVCPEGEMATVKAANASKIGMIASTLSTVTMEEIAHAATCPLWFQLYVYKDRTLTESLIRRAESCYSAIVLTVDTPIMGKREADIRHKFKLPTDLNARNFEKIHFISDDSILAGSTIKNYSDSYFDKSFTWEDITWIKSITNIPIILKGITHPLDAQLAVDHGVAAIIISNHGGRQLDTVPATITVLDSIAKKVNRQIPLLIDSGFRRGTDLFKALALGADAILLGRPILWALAVNGEQGVISLLQLLVQELIETMMLCGFTSIEEIKQNGDACIQWARIGR